MNLALQHDKEHGDGLTQVEQVLARIKRSFPAAGRCEQIGNIP
jgi:hypothetical protein